MYSLLFQEAYSIEIITIEVLLGQPLSSIIFFLSFLFLPPLGFEVLFIYDLHNISLLRSFLCLLFIIRFRVFIHVINTITILSFIPLGFGFM